jgi:hypothetical protein
MMTSPRQADQPAIGWMRLEDPDGHQAVRHTIPSQAPSRLELDIVMFVYAIALYFAGTPSDPYYSSLIRMYLPLKYV